MTDTAQPQGADRYKRSIELFEQSRQVLAGGVSSNFRLGDPPHPLFYDRAQGSRIWDVDGNEYVDYILGMGPLVLGHRAEAPVQAAKSWLDRVQLPTGQTQAELDAGHAFQKHIPCAERVRFCSSGSEAVQLALRLARAHTGKNRIVKFEGHYHGWMDGALISTHPSEELAGPYDAPASVPMSKGQSPSVLQDFIVLPWNEIELLAATLQREVDTVAAVIMEPVNCNTCAIPPQPGYLEAVRDLCTRLGIVLIFDEVITGFRLGLSGAQGLLGVTPDLATFAKAIANGFPLAAVAGKREIMEQVLQGALHGGTYNGAPPIMAAAAATIEALAADDGAAYKRMNAAGDALMTGLREVAARADQPFLVQGFGSVFHTSFTNTRAIKNYRDYVKHNDLPRLNRFLAGLVEHGVRVTSRGAWFLSAAHTASDVDHTIAAAERSMARL